MSCLAGKSAEGVLSCKDGVRVSSSFDCRKHNVDSFSIWKMSSLYEPECFYLDTRTDEHRSGLEIPGRLFSLDL